MQAGSVPRMVRRCPKKAAEARGIDAPCFLSVPGVK